MARTWLGWRGELDDLAHRLHDRHLLPRSVVGRICAWYEEASYKQGLSQVAPGRLRSGAVVKPGGCDRCPGVGVRVVRCFLDHAHFQCAGCAKQTELEAKELM